MQHHDPQMQNLEGTLTHDATPRRDEDEENAREQPREPSGATRKYYEF